jgi:hypothetical protein
MHGAIALGADGIHAVLHGDDFAGVDDLNGETTRVAVLCQFVAHYILLADQNDFHAQDFGGANRAFNFRFGRGIPAHCVHGNG